MYNNYYTYYKYLNTEFLYIKMRKGSDGERGRSITKTITLYESQVRFINENAINLSRFVQKSIEIAMSGKVKKWK